MSSLGPRGRARFDARMRFYGEPTVAAERKAPCFMILVSFQVAVVDLFFDGEIATREPPIRPQTCAK
jgi:hypothetical protein